MNLARRAADRASRLFHGGMNRNDYTTWRTARTLDDIGELTARWLEGSIQSQPGYQPGYGPDPETIPHIPVLAAACRTGFVTLNSQSADGPWNAWVDGLISEVDLAWLTTVTHGTDLTIDYRCRRGDHHGHQETFFWCPRRNICESLLRHSPNAAAAIRDAWYVRIIDPEPGRNSMLWPALAIYAGLVVTS